MSRSSAVSAQKSSADDNNRFVGPREAVYNEEIDPLVSRLVDLCIEYGIPIVIGVELDNAEDGSGQTVCVSYYSDNTSEPSAGVVSEAVELFSPGETE